MKPKNGFNPMLWDCERQGCFNLKCRPKIEKFAYCFPGRINFTDVDGLVEVNSNFLLLEWKTNLKDLPTGQRVLYGHLTQLSSIQTVFFVLGDAEIMTAEGMVTVYRGKRDPSEGYEPCDFDRVLQRAKDWSDWAEKQPPKKKKYVP